MKNQLIMKWLINPFERIAGWQALFAGLAAMTLTAVIGKINNLAFDGVLDIHVSISRSIGLSLICLPFYIWMITLKYNAYSVSCHLKGSKAIVSFIGALIVAEIISKLVLVFLLGSLFAGGVPLIVPRLAPDGLVGVIHVTRLRR